MASLAAYLTGLKLTVIPSEARNLALAFLGGPPDAEQDSPLRSVESHVIPAKAGIHRAWVPASAGTTAFVTGYIFGSTSAW
jgi:hypothetical protein